MSDPAKYRTKDELEKYKGLDPIVTTKAAIIKKKYAKEAWFEEVEADVKRMVDEAVKFAEESPYPDASELYKDVYAQNDYPYEMG